MTRLVFVRIGSHRALDKLTRMLGSPQTYFSHYHAGNLAETPEDRLTDALQIKGIRRGTCATRNAGTSVGRFQVAEKSHGKL